MGRYLVIANQTLGGAELERAVKERAAQGDASFFIVVPRITPAEEATAWSTARPGAVPPPSDEPDQGHKRAQHRLSHLIGTIDKAGGRADGQVGDSDPVEAVREALGKHEFDEVIISTLPARLSRWLKMDLPSKVSRLTDVPVTTVEAEG